MFTELGGIPGRAGRPGLAARVFVPFGARVRLLTHLGVPCPEGKWGGRGVNWNIKIDTYIHTVLYINR